MPPSHPRWNEIDEKLEPDHHARIVERQVNQLDRQRLDDLYENVGDLAFDPVLLLKMVLLQILQGHRSPAKGCREAKFNEAMQWLGRGYAPARRTWYLFRDRVGDVIDSLHQQLVSGAIEQGRMQLAGRMQIATEILCERIAQNATKAAGKRKDPAKIVVSMTDPVAPPGRDKFKVYRPLYTVQYVVDPVSRMILSYCCLAEATDAGTLAPMIDKTQAIVGGILRTMMADAAYCSILDLRDCQERNIDLLAPVAANSFTEAKKKSQEVKQIPREEFTGNEQEQSYRCPQGQEMNYVDRERKQRHGDRTLWESRYRGDADVCGACPLMSQCLRPGATRRTIKRLEGQELVDAQRAKMATPEVQVRYSVRGQSVELGFADAKAHRGLARFHGRGLKRAQTETGLLVLAQNLFKLDKLQQATNVRSASLVGTSKLMSKSFDPGKELPLRGFPAKVHWYTAAVVQS